MSVARDSMAQGVGSAVGSVGLTDASGLRAGRWSGRANGRTGKVLTW